MYSTFADCFFDGRFGQFGAIRVEYNQSGHLSICTLQFLRVLFEFDPTVSEARRVGAPRSPCEPRGAGRATCLRCFLNTFEFFKIQHQIGFFGGAGQVALRGQERAERQIGLFEFCRELPEEKRRKEHAKIVRRKKTYEIHCILS